LPPEAWALLQDSLWAWLHLGGIGSRSRNGFGSLSLRGVEGELPIGDRPTLPRLASAAGREELESGFRSLVAAACGRGVDAGWTCLSPSSRALVGPQKGSWREALGVAGAWLIAYRRRYGHPSDPRVRNGTPLANRDYVWAYSPANRQGVPDRSGFGLPLPFGKKHETATWGTQGNQGAFTDQRRASPLLLSVVRLGNGFAPVFTYLPSQFLPADAELGLKGRTTPRRAPNTLQLSIVDDFLDELASRKLAQEIR
jgi:CRISPR-associated protein Cmr1